MNENEAEVNIRKMSDVDIPDIIAVEKLISIQQTLLSEKDILTSDPENKYYRNFVAEAGGNIVGVIIARLVYVLIPVTEACTILGLFVHPDFQNRGIGARLVEALLDYCKSEEIDTIRAHVPQHNSELMNFFTRMGFHRSNIINMDKTFET